MRVFVAGAGGAVGKRLVPMLVARGHRVTGTTTNERSVDAIRALRAEPVVVDGLDAAGIGEDGPGASEALAQILRRRMFPVVGDGAGIVTSTHIDDAAGGTVAALERGRRGVYNIVDDEPAPAREFIPTIAQAIGAKPPLRIPAWLGRIFAGDVVVTMMTEVRGSSNAKAKRELGWQPIWPSWRDGFRRGLDAPVPLPSPAEGSAPPREGSVA